MLAAYVSTWMLTPTMFVYAYCMIRKGPSQMKLKPFLAFTLVIFLAGAINASAESPAIGQIRKLYQDTKSLIAKGELLATKVDSIADIKYSDELAEHLDCSGPIVMFYWPERGHLQFAEVFSALEGVALEEEYLFYPDGKLAFCYTKLYRVLSTEVYNEERFYFDKGALVRYISGSKTVDSGFSSEVILGGKAKLENAALLSRTFQVLQSLDSLRVGGSHE